MFFYVITISMKSYHMLQQNLYNENNRYIKWIFKNYKQWKWIIVFYIEVKCN